MPFELSGIKEFLSSLRFVSHKSLVECCFKAKFLFDEMQPFFKVLR